MIQFLTVHQSIFMLRWCCNGWQLHHFISTLDWHKCNKTQKYDVWSNTKNYLQNLKLNQLKNFLEMNSLWSLKFSTLSLWFLTSSCLQPCAGKEICPKSTFHLCNALIQLDECQYLTRPWQGNKKFSNLLFSRVQIFFEEVHFTYLKPLKYFWHQ